MVHDLWIPAVAGIHNKSDLCFTAIICPWRSKSDSSWVSYIFLNVMDTSCRIWTAVCSWNHVWKCRLHIPSIRKILFIRMQVHQFLHTFRIIEGAWVRFLMVSMEFFIDAILLATLWLWESTQPLTEMSTRNISWGG